jgi:hypothetical protein
LVSNVATSRQRPRALRITEVAAESATGHTALMDTEES